MSHNVGTTERNDPSTTPFFPNFILLEALAALAMFVVIVLVSALTKPPLEAAASRGAAYLPRPEWYFLWFFELLRYFQGGLELVGAFVLPAVGVLLLLCLPFLDRREPKTKVLVHGTRPVRVAPRVIGALFILVLGYLTLAAALSSRPPAAAPVPSPMTVPRWP
jgi:quinol-cytochrome oxidoreductase complex cytochrome b subunit